MMTAAIERHDVPGAVALVSVGEEIVLHQAYGHRSLVPTIEPMTGDTLFDLASLTKPIATATLVHWLAHQGKFSLRARLRTFFSELDGVPLGEATPEHLLLHTSGLDADLPAGSHRDGIRSVLALLRERPLIAPPGEQSRYSDIGYQLLGVLVARLSNTPLAQLFARVIAEPLNTPTLTFAPAAELHARAAPTERRGELWLRGVAHDPRVAPLGGAAGHAGLFGTAGDLGRFCRMLLARGVFEGRTVLAPAVAEALLKHQRVPKGTRTLGWDAESGMQTSRGEMFPPRGLGHLGFTGTSVWMDPPTNAAIVLLTSRLHPEGKGTATPLRKGLSTAAGRRVLARVFRGVDVALGGHPSLQNRRLGLLTHAAAVDLQGRRSIDALLAAGYSIHALFSPEHGLASKADAKIQDSKDEATGLPIHSLYGNHLRPSDAQLSGLDALVIDLQDAGGRFYTYLATMGYVLEEASKRGLPVVVLDRPNPLGGAVVEGPLRDEEKESFVAYHQVPVRHGMTLGELARMVVAERKLQLPLEVIPMEGWRREMLWEDTGLPWLNPSPNLRNPRAALLYPGLGLLELTNLSVGRGTDHPFEQIGAPWLQGSTLARALNDEKIPGVRASANRFTPTSGPFQKEPCEGIFFTLTDPRKLPPVKLGMTLAQILWKYHKNDWKPNQIATLLVHRATLDGLLRGQSAGEMAASWEADRAAFLERRRPFLLYEDAPSRAP